MRAIVWGHVF